MIYSIVKWVEAATMAIAAIYSWNAYRKCRDRRVGAAAVVLSLCAASVVLFAV
jgi:hypothetical protein